MKRLTFVFSLLVACLALPMFHAAAQAAGETEVGEFTFKPVAPWTKNASPRPMSAGGYVLPEKDGVALDAALYHFPGQGGDLEANVTRWTGMFEKTSAPKAEREELTFGGKKATLVKLTGTYVGSSFRPETEPRKDWTMLAAILHSEKGHVFVRMTGPTLAVTTQAEAFKQLIGSAYGAPAPTPAPSK
jgi:hypothetical protein